MFFCTALFDVTIMVIHINRYFAVALMIKVCRGMMSVEESTLY